MSNQKVDVIIAIGCVIKGETDHYDYICSSVANGIMKLNLSLEIPVIFCVLTDHDKGQSLERSGGKHGNKGVEAALSALKNDIRLNIILLILVNQIVIWAYSI